MTKACGKCSPGKANGRTGIPCTETPRARVHCTYPGLGKRLDDKRIAERIIANVAVQVYTITVAGRIGVHAPPFGFSCPPQAPLTLP